MRLVASFTTIPSRLDKIFPMVDSIVGQTRKPDRFVLWLPPYCDKENAEYKLTEDTKRRLFDSGVDISFCDRDWGPATKLIPILKTETDGDTLIMTFDDDVVYDRHTIDRLESAVIQYPDTALGFMGTSNKRFIHGESLWGTDCQTALVDCLGGYRGCAYRRNLFDDSIFDDITTMLADGLFVTDDQLISWNLFRRSIALRVIRAEVGKNPNNINSVLLDLGGGIYSGSKEQTKLACASLDRLKNMYDKNNWRRPV